MHPVHVPFPSSRQKSMESEISNLKSSRRKRGGTSSFGSKKNKKKIRNIFFMLIDELKNNRECEFSIFSYI